MKSPLIIGIGHRARQGKDVVCAEMIHRAAAVPLVVRRYSIGDEILSYCIDNGIIPEITREEIQQKRPEMLRVLQRVGQERREICPNVWLERILQRIAHESPDVAVIPNVRVPVEAQAVRDAGGITVKVERLNADGSVYIAEDRPPNDETETALTLWNWDFVLRARNGEQEWLRRQAAGLLEYLWERK